MSLLDPSLNPTEGLGLFYDYLWGNESGWVYLPTKDPNTDEWTKTLYEWPKDKRHVIRHTLAKTGEGREVYVAPAIFREPKPLKENVKGSNTLWVDFDGNAPSEWPPQPNALAEAGPVPPEPSLRVCSSVEGHEHCYWKLDEFTNDVEFIENTNRAMAYKLKADTSGWDMGQVLRPPYTTNYKRNESVHVIDNIDVTYKQVVFAGYERVKQLVSESIEIADIPDALDVVAKYPWDASNFELFKKTEIEEGKRSSALMALGFFGAESGMKDEEIYSLLLHADDRWGKFKNRSDRKKRLLDIINRARQKHPVGINTQEAAFRGLLSDESNVEVKTKLVFGWDEFNKTEVNIEWAIDGLLEKGGMGVLVSGPGIGKTQLSLQFAISCCLGREWLMWKISKRMKILWLSLEMTHPALKYFTTQIASGYSETENMDLDRNLKIVPLGEVLPLDHPEGRKFLESLIEEYKPDGIIIDSMGKVTNSSLSEEEKIKTLNSYYSRLRKTHGLFLWFVHHNRKANAENKKPTNLDDVYGNQYIAAETTVALGLWRNKGNKDIEVNTLKSRLAPEQPMFKIKRVKNLAFEIIDRNLTFDGITGGDSKPNDKPSNSSSDSPTDESKVSFNF